MKNPTPRKVWAHRPAPRAQPQTPALLMPIEFSDTLNAGAFGGTATVHRITTAPYLYMAAKIFNPDVVDQRRTASVHDKLVFIAGASEALRRGFVANGVMQSGRPHVAWPEALLYDANAADVRHLVGFAMPLFADGLPLAKLTSPKQRKTAFPNLPADGLLLAAGRLAAAVMDVHGRDGRSGITIGDLTPRNILITQDLKIRLIDADSYQYMAGHRIYGSADTTPGFRSPRMAEAARAGQILPPFTPDDDAFCLAIALFHILVDGAHPFTAGERFEVNGVKPDEEDNVLAQRFVYADPGKYFPPKIRQQTYQKLHADLRGLFEQAFLTPLPPAPHLWLAAITRARDAMSAAPHGAATPRLAQRISASAA